MEIPLPEIIDRITIVKLKIERVGEPQLKIELKEYEKALEEFKKRGVQIKQEWFDKLYEFNKGIWDNEFDVRKIADEVRANLNFKIDDKKLEDIGKRYIRVGRLMKERDALKNEIVEEIGEGFKITKMDHSAE